MENMIEFSKFCSPEEILLSDELWSFLSGERDTMKTILDIIKDISEPSFIDNFSFICSCHSIDLDRSRYREIADKWHLYDEVAVVDNWDKIKEASEKSIVSNRYASAFNDAGKYNEKRSAALMKFIAEKHPCLA